MNKRIRTLKEMVQFGRYLYDFVPYFLKTCYIDAMVYIHCLWFPPHVVQHLRLEALERTKVHNAIGIEPVKDGVAVP